MPGGLVLLDKLAGDDVVPGSGARPVEPYSVWLRWFSMVKPPSTTFSPGGDGDVGFGRKRSV